MQDRVKCTGNIVKFLILYSILFRPKFCFYTHILFLKILSGMASLIWVCSVCTCHFVGNFGVQNFWTFTIHRVASRNFQNGANSHIAFLKMRQHFRCAERFLPSENRQTCKLMESRELFVCVEVLRPSQPNGVMSSAVSLPNHTFTGQA